MKGIRLTNPVAVGDWVDIELTEGENLAVITGIRPRKNYIIRKSTKLSKEAHILAANVDQAIVVATLREPTTFSVFIDRFLVSAEAYKIPARIIFNKVDLCTEDDLDELAYWKASYEGAGYPCFETSVPEKQGLEQIVELLKNKTSMFSGNSGVGKSSLINAIDPSLDLKVSTISTAHLSGKHTTTYAEMFELSFGGGIIDTPGIKGFGTVDIEKDELYHFFPELFAEASHCRYHNCTHAHEPDCAVLAAVETGKISPMRYENYLSMLADEDDKYRKTPW